MPLVMQITGLLEGCELLRLNLMPGVQVGLGTADIIPDQTTSLAAILPATFSGYPGLLVVGAWTPAVIVGNRAVITSTPIVYLHSGGPIGQVIFTYYALNSAGDLIWCERLAGAPFIMAEVGNELTVSPEFTFRSQF